MRIVVTVLGAYLKFYKLMCVSKHKTVALPRLLRQLFLIYLMNRFGATRVW